MTGKQSSRILRGDIYAVPLEEGSWGYVRYWGPGPRGPQLGLFGLKTSEIVTADEVLAAGHEFTVILAQFADPVKSGEWTWIGRVAPPKNPDYLLISGMGVSVGISTWYLIKPDKSIMLGKSLPSEYARLEPNIIFPGSGVSHRLCRGTLPPPFDVGFRQLDLPRPDSPAPWLVELFCGP